MASPEQLARFFSALQFDQESVRPAPVGAPRVVRQAHPELTAQRVPMSPRDPYRPVDPVWVIAGFMAVAIIMVLLVAFQRAGGG